MSYEILLINVARDHSSVSEAFRDSIGQYSIVSYLKRKDFKAFVFSGDIKKCKKVIEKEISNGKTNIVGFYIAADNIEVVGHIIGWTKQNYPDCKTVVGGPQAAGLNYQFFAQTQNDYAILGEGEIPMYYLLTAIVDKVGTLSQVPGLIRKAEQEEALLVNSSENAIITNLDEIGYPMKEDSLTGRLRQGEIVGIITGRGCPYHCSFCYEGANAKNVRFRSISNVMNEIDYICTINPNVKFISIYDDTFTLKKERIFEFCREIKRRELLWFCEGHISFVINEVNVLKTMIDSGLSCIQFGIESGSNKVLNAYNKHTNFDMILSAIKICKKLGLHSITGNFIIGGAFESNETIEKSKELAKKLIHEAKGIIELYTVYFAPYPNTKMVREPEIFEINILEKMKEININTMRTPVVETKKLSRNQIYDLKHEFDCFIQNEYKKAVEESTKTDIMQGLVHNGRRISLNPTWEKLYLGKPHIVTFLEHIREEEQVFNEDFYIIRTFEDIKIENDELISDVGKFRGLEKDILMFATGRYKATDMAEKFHVSIKQIKECYEKLNEQCFVYISEF